MNDIEVLGLCSITAIYCIYIFIAITLGKIGENEINFIAGQELFLIILFVMLLKGYGRKNEK